jgi:hypothetical protein
VRQFGKGTLPREQKFSLKQIARWVTNLIELVLHLLYSEISPTRSRCGDIMTDILTG